MLPDRPRALALTFGRRFAVDSSAVDSHGRVQLDASELVPLVSITSSLVATGTEGLPSLQAHACSESRPPEAPCPRQGSCSENLLSQSPRPRAGSSTEDLPSQSLPFCTVKIPSQSPSHLAGSSTRAFIQPSEIRLQLSGSRGLLNSAHLASVSMN